MLPAHFGRLQGWIDLLVDQLEAELRVADERVKPGDSDGQADNVRRVQTGYQAPDPQQELLK